MDIKPEKMKLDIRQVSNPLYLGNVGDILHPKSPKVSVFERSGGIIIPGGPSVFVEIFGKKLKILNWSPIMANPCQWMANQLTDCCYVDWTSATSLGLERFFEIRYLPANSLLKILKCSMLYRKWQIDLGPWTSCTHWDSVCCCFFAAFFSQNIATKPHTAPSVFVVRLSQQHFFVILSQLHLNEKMRLLKGGLLGLWQCF